MKNLKSIFALLLLVSIMILTFQNCAPMESQKMSSTNSSLSVFNIDDYPEEKILEGFETTLQPILTSTCYACHDSIQSPRFAQADPATSYDVIRTSNLVNFVTPANSKFVNKIMAGHNGLPTTIAQDIKNAVDDWKDFLIASNEPDPTPTPSPTATPATDTVMPNVNFTAPANNGTVSGTVNLAANATDNVGVVGVRFTLDGTNIDIEDTTAPYSFSWNSTTATNGSHTLGARARDAAGNVKTVTITVTVNNATNANATYTWLAANVFSTRCTSCHSGANAPDNVVLGNYNGVKAQVVVGNANNSLLYQSVTRANNKMPKNANALTTTQINNLRDWINTGALNN